MSRIQPTIEWKFVRMSGFPHTIFHRVCFELNAISAHFSCIKQILDYFYRRHGKRPLLQNKAIIGWFIRHYLWNIEVAELFHLIISHKMMAAFHCIILMRPLSITYFRRRDRRSADDVALITSGSGSLMQTHFITSAWIIGLPSVSLDEVGWCRRQSMISVPRFEMLPAWGIKRRRVIFRLVSATAMASPAWNIMSFTDFVRFSLHQNNKFTSEKQ